MDTVFTTRVAERTHNNPLFLNRGKAGNAEIFLTFWDYFLKIKDRVAEEVEKVLIGDASDHVPTKIGKGMPFFPDTIKTYNLGLGWVTEKYRFNGLDYILAVEGAFAMRGSVARTLAANSKRFAAFPFVFDSCEDMVDDANEVKGTAQRIVVSSLGQTYNVFGTLQLYQRRPDSAARKRSAIRRGIRASTQCARRRRGLLRLAGIPIQNESQSSSMDHDWTLCQIGV